MSSTSRPPIQHLRSQVTDLCTMTWRWLSFSHVWIGLGAFTTTMLSGLWSSPESWWRPEGWMFAWWVGATTGVGYSVQRAIKHVQHPQHMPSERRRFWDEHNTRMLVTWGALWVAVTACFYDELHWHRSERQLTLAFLGLVSLAYSVVPGFVGGLRRVAWLKVPIIAGVWATATTLHPSVAFEPWLWAQRFVFIASLTLPFDIRDLAVDRSHIHTVASIKSPVWVLRIARLGMLVSAAMCMFTLILGAANGAGFAAGPAMCLAQSFWGWSLLRHSKALAALTSCDDDTKEKYAGWTLDGVLVAPLFLLAIWWFVTTIRPFVGKM